MSEPQSPQRKVYVTMVGDLFHYGHVEFLKRAREYGDYLVVGVLTDEMAADYKRQPILSLDERMGPIRACRHVDEVRIHDKKLSNEWLEQHGFTARVLALGSDAERERNQSRRQRLRPEYRIEVPYEPNISTTAILSRIKARKDL